MARGLGSIVSRSAVAGAWTVGAFVTNLTDESYIIDAGNTGDSLGLPTFIGGRPRMWGVTMGWKYQPALDGPEQASHCSGQPEE